MSGHDSRPVAVIGAGPAGLATSARLNRHAIRHWLTESRDHVGSSWRRHYARLHLHTVKQWSALPNRPFPSHYPQYVPRDQVVEYLDDYAKHFGLEPLFGQTVRSLGRGEATRWHIATDDRAFDVEHVVVATGYNRTPKRPSWPGQASFAGRIVHSAEYESGAAYRGQRVLVVGIGNSGAEIAIDLWEHGAETALSVRSPRYIAPRDLFGVPAQLTSIALSRLPRAVGDAVGRRLLRRAVGDLSRYGLHVPDEGPVTQVEVRGRVPLVDIGTVALIKQGKLSVRPNITRFEADGVVFEDGVRAAFDAVILATGYHAGLTEFLADADEVIDDRGYPKCYGEWSSTTSPRSNIRRPPTPFSATPSTRWPQSRRGSRTHPTAFGSTMRGPISTFPRCSSG